MRVVHVFKDYWPPTRGGIEQHVHEVVHGVRMPAAVVTSSRSRRRIVDDDDGVPVIRLPEVARPASTPVIRGLVRTLRALRPGDVAHLHVPNPGAEMAWLRARPEAPLVVTYHADNPRSGATRRARALRRLTGPVYDPVQQRLLRRAARIVVSSPAMAARPALRAHRARVEVIPFGVDPEEWAPRPARADEIRAGRPGPLVVFLGRLVHYKGLDVLAEAMRGLDARCAVVGDGPLAGRIDAPDNVEWVGAVPDGDRAAWYHAADVFVLPSTGPAETFGISMLQALACGTPAVCTEVGTGTSWLNLDRETGLVVPPGDVRALRGALRALLSDDGLRASYGAAARDRTERLFSRRRMFETLEASYADVAGRPDR